MDVNVKKSNLKPSVFRLNTGREIFIHYTTLHYSNRVPIVSIFVQRVVQLTVQWSRDNWLVPVQFGGEGTN